MPSRMEGRSIYYYPALINAYHVDGFEINGLGLSMATGANSGGRSGSDARRPGKRAGNAPT